MGYTALYRKFRPLTFNEMVGQEHITKTLKNQIISGRVGHAYLFNGGRGTGKTSAAKVLARAINCLNPQDGEPCNECEICKGAISGSLTDIVEMDAASNNSVDDVRGIKEEVNFLPTKAKYRVYIIDEVHMLSVPAFNALLKTLEEPPEHVKFILATTEPQKLPATILSRCQRFDFKRISNENIIKRLKIVCQESNIEATNEALNMIAELSEGAMRDALSILERCVQNGENNIDEEKIRDLIGIPKTISVHNMVEAIVNYDIDHALKEIDNLLQDGKDVNNFLWEIIKYIKDILIIKTNGTVNLYSQDDLTRLKQLSENISKDKAINLIYNLSELENNMKYPTQKLIMFQAGIIKLCNKQSETNNTVTSNQGNNNLEDRITRIENYLKSGAIKPASAGGVKRATNTQPKPSANAQSSTAIKKSNYSSATQEFWPQIINDLKANKKMVLYSNLMNTVATEINDLTIGIEFPSGLTPFAKTMLERPENIKIITDMVSIAKGKEMHIKYIDSGKQDEIQQSNVDNIENFANSLDIPFNIID
jgi:DNA polymerase-3 subunit gamma/tau